MPKHIVITCQICRRTETKPWVSEKPPNYCSKFCENMAWQRNIESRIGESLEQALDRLYVRERKSYREISKILDINHRTVMRRLRRYSIEPRRGGDAVKVQWENNIERRIRQSNWFRKVASENTRENHPRWRGGKSYDTSDKSWMKFAEEIRKRDGYQCTRCNKTNEENIRDFKKVLEVHHIIPFILSQDNSPNNLCSLCFHCHRIVEQQFIWVL